MGKVANDLRSRIRHKRAKNAPARQRILKRKKHGGIVDQDEETGEVKKVKDTDMQGMMEFEKRMKFRNDLMNKTAELMGDKDAMVDTGETETTEDTSTQEEFGRSVEKRQIAPMVKGKETVSIKDSTFVMYIPFQKVTKKKDGTIEVSGIASRQEIDNDGDITMLEAVREAIPEYMKFGNIREMHSLSAVGTVMEEKIVEELQAWWIKVHIVDPVAVKKVLTGVYKGFSLGGDILDADPMEGVSPDGIPLRFKITKIRLLEVSLVDRPASPSALIDMVKASKTVKAPEHSVVFHKPKASLTKTKETAKVEPSPQATKYGNSSFSSSLLSKLSSMSNINPVEQATNAALVKLAGNGLDLTKAEGSREFNALEIAELIQFGVQEGIAYAKASGTDGDGEEEGDEGDNTEVETEVETEEESEESTEEETEGESSETSETDEEEGEEGGEEEEEESTESEPAELQKSKSGKKKKMKKFAKSTSTDAALLPVVQQLTKTVSTLQKSVKKLSKGQSAQSTEELRKQAKKDEASFRGVFL